MLIIFWIFSRGYVLVKYILKRLVFYYISLHILGGYVYSLYQNFQGLRLFKGVRLFQTLEYAVFWQSPIKGVRPIPYATGVPFSPRQALSSHPCQCLCLAIVLLSHRSQEVNECGLGALQHSLWPDIHSIHLAVWTKASLFHDFCGSSWNMSSTLLIYLKLVYGPRTWRVHFISAPDQLGRKGMYCLIHRNCP